MPYTLQQLLRMSWLDRDVAVTTLARSDFRPVNKEFELRRDGPHSWGYYPRTARVATIWDKPMFRKGR